MAVPSHAARRLAVIGALSVAAAAAVLAWKLRGGAGERVAPVVAVTDPVVEPAPTDPLEVRSTPLTQHLRRLVSPEARARLLAAIGTAHEQQPAGSRQALSLTRVEIQAAMEEVRPLIVECHEMALERTPGFAPAVGGTLHLTYPFVFRAAAPVDPAGPTHRLPQPNSLDPQTLVNQARGAAKGGEWGRALKLVQQALDQAPADQDALMVGVLAACKLRKGDRAKDYTSRLSSTTRRAMARQSCLKHGIEVGDD